MHFLLLEEVWLTFGVAAAVYGVYLNTSKSVYFKFLLLKLSVSIQCEIEIQPAESKPDDRLVMSGVAFLT